ncbi:carbohydrate-binding protein [Georgenia sp. MJ170]|uniref:carbohydrate-binding protein n=1 Tax=Georgenia sunbinii TaxID=3117728 RepID=UPI002F26008D
MNDDELRAATLDELMGWRAAIDREVDRRELLDNAPAEMDTLTRAVLAAEGQASGGPWTQPAGGHDAYPRGWRVEHAGRCWESLTPANVWEPGTSGWREVTDDGAVPEWVQPTGAHDAYNTGDRVTYEGRLWESLIDGNAWNPVAHPAGWRLIENEGAGNDAG